MLLHIQSTLTEDIGLTQLLAVRKQGKDLSPGAAVWPGIDSTVESLPVLRISPRLCQSLRIRSVRVQLRPNEQAIATLYPQIRQELRLFRLEHEMHNSLRSLRPPSPNWRGQSTDTLCPRRSSHSAAGACSRWKSACSSSKRESICCLMREL